MPGRSGLWRLAKYALASLNKRSKIYTVLTRHRVQWDCGIGWRANGCRVAHLVIPNLVRGLVPRRFGMLRIGIASVWRGLTVRNGDRDGLSAFDIIQRIIANRRNLTPVQTIANADPDVAPVGQPDQRTPVIGAAKHAD